MNRHQWIAVAFSAASVATWWLLAKGNWFVLMGAFWGAVEAVEPKEMALRERIERLLNTSVRWAVLNLYWQQWR